MVTSFSVIVLGSGVSTAVPSIRHILDGNECIPCSQAMNDSNNKNRRNNVSIAIVYNTNDGIKKTIMIDAGKTMRDSIMKHFPANGIKEVNNILITHGHADAILGLDDVRDLQKSSRVSAIDPHTNQQTIGFKIESGHLPIIARRETHDTIANVFPYLINKPIYLDEDQSILAKRIALIKAVVIDDNEELDLDGLHIRTFPVYHGGDYISLGFTIGNKLVYISDVKIIPEETWAYLKALPIIEILIIDALDKEGMFSHCSLQEAIDISKQLNPSQVLFTGMSCGIGLHDEIEKELIDMGLVNYKLAYDGLKLNFHS